MNAIKRICENEMASVLSRREMLSRLGSGCGIVGLAAVLADDLVARPPALSAEDTGSIGAPSVTPLSPKSPHYEPRAKRVIHLFMNGGPSQVDTFDP
jgi:hypothetical protein